MSIFLPRNMKKFRECFQIFLRGLEIWWFHHQMKTFMNQFGTRKRKLTLGILANMNKRTQVQKPQRINKNQTTKIVLMRLFPIWYHLKVLTHRQMESSQPLLEGVVLFLIAGQDLPCLNGRITQMRTFPFWACLSHQRGVVLLFHLQARTRLLWNHHWQIILVICCLMSHSRASLENCLLFLWRIQDTLCPTSAKG